jgi:hypothetical protein
MQYEQFRPNGKIDLSDIQEIPDDFCKFLM